MVRAKSGKWVIVEDVLKALDLLKEAKANVDAADLFFEHYLNIHNHDTAVSAEETACGRNPNDGITNSTVSEEDLRGAEHVSAHTFGRMDLLEVAALKKCLTVAPKLPDGSNFNFDGDCKASKKEKAFGLRSDTDKNNKQIAEELKLSAVAKIKGMGGQTVMSAMTIMVQCGGCLIFIDFTAVSVSEVVVELTVAYSNEHLSASARIAVHRSNGVTVG